MNNYVLVELMVPKVIFFQFIVSYCFLCVYTDTCGGDSGGPLMMFSNNQWILVGLTSYGRRYAEPAFVSIYTHVAAYQDWINTMRMSAAYIQIPSSYYISFAIFLSFLSF
jgi:secreted trypsin-like serine protease